MSEDTLNDSSTKQSGKTEIDLGKPQKQKKPYDKEPSATPKKKGVVAYAKKHKIILICIIGAVIFGFWYLYSREGNSEENVQYITAQVTTGNIVSTISGTGQITESNTINITPKTSATVSKVVVAEGDVVAEGAVLIQLDQTTAYANLVQAQANLDSAQESYNEVIDGTASEDVKIAQLKVDSAQTSLDNAKTDYDDTVDQQQTAVDNAYRTLLNSGISGTASATMKAAGNNSSTASIVITGTYTGSAEGQYKLTLSTTDTEDEYTYTVSGLEPVTGTVTAGRTKKLGSDGLYFTISDDEGSTVKNNSTWNLTLPDTRSSNYLANYNNYQTALQSQTKSINQAANSIETAESNLEQAEADLEKLKSDATPAELSAAEAQVATASSQLQTAQAEYDAATITAPFGGIVSELNVVPGDQASPSTAVATMITEDQVVTLALNEVDIPNISVGDKATITFDAVENTMLTGSVTNIDSIGTVDQGVVSYNIQLSLDAQDDRIKSGMTASVAIVTGMVNNVLTIANSAVKSNSDGSNYVEVLDENGQPQQVTIMVGMSNDTTTEILDGLNEGDAVITQTISTDATASGNTDDTSGFSQSGFGGGASPTGTFRVNGGPGGF